jgi:hypothetical protein
VISDPSVVVAALANIRRAFIICRLWFFLRAVISAIDRNLLEAAVEVDLDLAPITLDHLDLPGDAPLVLALGAPDATAADGVDGRPLRSLGFRATDPLIGLVARSLCSGARFLGLAAHRLGDAKPTGAHTKDRGCHDRMLPSEGHPDLLLVVAPKPGSRT